MPAATLSGPYIHENLALFLLHGPDAADTSRYVTLEEALKRGKVSVQETGHVGQLLIENLCGDRDVFIQTGEIVRGGRQDRTIRVDLVVPAGTKVPLPTYCVESGRWHGRPGESIRDFRGSSNTLAGKDLKFAARTTNNQGEVWRAVSEAQEKLSCNLESPVRDPRSPSSFELAMGGAALSERRKRFQRAFASIMRGKADVFGFVYAVNGRLYSAETYASHALFRKLWKKVLGSAIVEALLELDGPRAAAAGGCSAVTVEQARAFLERCEAGQADRREITERVWLHTRRTPGTALFETEDRLLDARVHKNYLAGVA